MARQLVDIRPKIDATRGARAALDVISTREKIKTSRAQEERAKETFALNKKAEDTRQKLLVEQEADRVEDRKIDLTQKMYGIAVDNGDLEGADALLFELGELSGFPMAGNHVEINGLLNRRAEFVKAEDVDGAEAVDTYMANRFGTTPEGAARMLKRTGEAEEFGAERKFEQKLEQEETQFEIKTERTKKEQADIRETTTAALAGVEGLDDTMKSLLPLISSREVSAGVLNVISAQTGVTFRTGLLGTEPETKGKPVTAAFDKAGKKIFEFPETETKDKAQRKIFESKNLLGETTVRGVVWSEDANGNPILKYVTPQEEEGAVQVTKSEDTIKVELGKVEGSDILPIDTFLEGFRKNNPGVLDRELTPEEIQGLIALYKADIEELRTTEEEGSVKNKVLKALGMGKSVKDEKTEKIKEEERELKKSSIEDIP